jgi:hypothetical protein
MITMDRLLCICEDWALYMKSHDSHKLGYPSKSAIGMSAQEVKVLADAFEDMVSAQDLKNVHIVETQSYIHYLKNSKTLYMLGFYALESHLLMSLNYN